MKNNLRLITPALDLDASFIIIYSETEHEG